MLLHQTHFIYIRISMIALEKGGKGKYDVKMFTTILERIKISSRNYN